jgi:16S rRNA G527 N7-methylase RsmG
LTVVYGWVEKLIKPNGVYIAWKGGEVRQEIEHFKERNKNINVDIVQMDDQFVHSSKDRVFVRVKRIESNKRGED